MTRMYSTNHETSKISAAVTAPIGNGSGVAVETSDLFVVADGQQVNLVTQRQTIWSRIDDTFFVDTISPKANLTYPEARFSIVLPDGASFIGTPVVESITYYDADGYVTTGLMPTISIIQ